MSNNNGKKMCPFCNSELVYIRWGFPRLNTPKPERAGSNRVEIGGCLPCGYEFECFECDRCFTYELEEVKFENDNPRDKVRLNKNEVVEILKLRNLSNNIRFEELIKKANINMDYNDDKCIKAKERLVVRTFFVKGQYKENKFNVICPKCKGNISAKIIYNINEKREGLYIENFESKADYVPQYRCLLCDKEFKYINGGKYE